MYLAPQNIPCAVVLTLGNKVVLYHPSSVSQLSRSETYRKKYVRDTQILDGSSQVCNVGQLLL